MLAGQAKVQVIRISGCDHLCSHPLLLLSVCVEDERKVNFLVTVQQRHKSDGVIAVDICIFCDVVGQLVGGVGRGKRQGGTD